MIKFVYKICSISEWNKFQKEKKFFGTKKDLLDGYIHFSNKNQIKKTLKKYFFKIDDLILLKVKVFKLKKLKWEKSKEGKVFPHLYSLLDIENVKSVHKITLKKNDLHAISPTNWVYE